MTHLFKRTIVILLTLALFIPPGQSKAGIFDADVSLPIPELQGLIQQLQDAGNHVDQVLKQTIDQVFLRANQLLDNGTGSIATVISSSFVVIAKVIIVILVFILLFWLIRNLWLQKFPQNKVLRFGIPSLLIILA